ncbi:MAG: Shikimate dehydrogenase [Methanoregulaceae archaeon PtaB.Bin108]|nr:MAG: Shikimate dehydrogenase [Methanoregulaceae archaeon PtaB.Bin108]
MNVVLIGFRGTGKTESGRLLARLLDVPFYDSDALVEEEAGSAVHEIFEREGEEGFRAREKRVIAGLPPGPGVFATGGGVILDPENVERLRRGRTVILLSADEVTIEKRIQHSTRPALTRMGLRAEIHALLEARKDAYLAAADFCVDTSARSANEVAMIIKRILVEGVTREEGRKDALRFVESSGIPAAEVEQLAAMIRSIPENPAMRFYGIAGFPSLHSRSPPLFQRLFSYFEINAFYTRFHDPSFSRIFSIAQDMGVRGLSVTIPFKQEVLQYLDHMDEHSKAIGACNTALLCGDESYGYNTDWVGIRDPLASLSGSTAVILGAGGAAASAAYALRSLDMEITILNRTVERAVALAARFGCHHGSFRDFDGIKPAVVVNATPVGMEPDTASPLAKSQLSPSMTVFDLVYTPPETPLLRAARSARCTVIPGKEMFIRQAKAQFRQFTGIDAPLEMMREIVG